MILIYTRYVPWYNVPGRVFDVARATEHDFLTPLFIESHQK